MDYDFGNGKRPVGRPRLSLETSDLVSAYRKLGNWELVASYFGVSRSTVMSRLKKAGIKREYIFKG